MGVAAIIPKRNAFAIHAQTAHPNMPEELAAHKPANTPVLFKPGILSWRN